MKFDYKILIFLGLACACFYLYREQYYLRTNISKLESKLSNNEKKILSIENNIATINKNINKPIETKNNLDTLKEQLKQIELTRMEEYESVNKCKIDSPKKITIDLGKKSPSKNDISKLVINTDSEKHLAIYSNDNDPYDDALNSLLESAEASKTQLEFNYQTNDNNLENDNNNLENDTKLRDFTNVEDLINSLSKTHESEENCDNNDASNNNDATIIVNSEKSNQNDNNIICDIICDKIENENTNYTLERLEKMRLPEIKKIANNFNIKLMKTIKGQQKPKNKQEIIEDIINHPK